MFLFLEKYMIMGMEYTMWVWERWQIKSKDEIMMYFESKNRKFTTTNELNETFSCQFSSDFVYFFTSFVILLYREKGANRLFTVC